MFFNATLVLSGSSLPSLLAYIGPGAGLDLIGALIGLIATVGTSSAFILLWPIRALLRGRKRPDSIQEECTVN